jgi:hypothetical protein
LEFSYLSGNVNPKGAKVGFSFSPDDIAKYIPVFRSLPAWGQLLIVIGVVGLISAWLSWRLGRSLLEERMKVLQATIDRLKGMSPSEALDQIRRLEAMVVELQRERWRTITPTQRDKFVSSLQNIGVLQNSIIEILVIGGDVEAEKYGLELSKLLREVGINTGYSGYS